MNAPPRPRRRILLIVAPLAVLVLVVAAGATVLVRRSDRPPAPPPLVAAVRDIGVDPQSYIDDYEQAEDTDGAVASPSAGAAAPTSTVAGRGGVVAPDLPPGPFDDNTFVDPGHQRERATATDGTSTFGLDVDTGSFNVARKAVDHGRRPDPAGVRTEEFVNTVDYGYADPAGAIGITVDAAPSPFAPDRTVARIGVQAARPTGQRKPANIVLVVDTSGSMDIRSRLGTVKASLALLARHLPDGDTVSVVTYDSDAGILLEPTPVSDTGAILDAIDELTPGGSTNLEAGLKTGYDLARRAYKPDGINRVVLASDGVANTGNTDPVELARYIQGQAGDGIQLVTVGYGLGNYDDDLMEQLADRGDGFYAYVDSYQEAEDLFARKLNQTIETVAIDAKAQVTFDPATVISWRQLGYDNRELADDDFDDATVDAGELNAGHAATVLYELALAPGAAPDAVLGTVEVRWDEPGSGAARSTSATLTAGDVATSWDEADPGLRVAAAVAAGAEVLGQRPEVQARGVTLDRVVAELDRAVVEVPAPVRPSATEAADLFRAAVDADPPADSTTGSTRRPR